jgi:hypothetical protein
MRKRTLLMAGLGAVTLFAQDAVAQNATAAARLREVLPAEQAERIIARIAEARRRDLPADALEQRALKFAARGVEPRDIERSVVEHAERMSRTRDLIQSSRRRAESAEIEAGAEALRRGVRVGDVSALAKETPSGRSLAVPLFVVGSLVERGLPSDSALRRVNERLRARASDADLERMAREPGTPTSSPRRPAETGREVSETRRTTGGGGNGGGSSSGARPTGVKPTTPTTPRTGGTGGTGGTTNPRRGGGF